MRQRAQTPARRQMEKPWKQSGGGPSSSSSHLRECTGQSGAGPTPLLRDDLCTFEATHTCSNFDRLEIKKDVKWSEIKKDVKWSESPAHAATCTSLCEEYSHMYEHTEIPQ
jgi:hypothetical protein